MEIREEILEHNRRTGEAIEAHIKRVDEAIEFLTQCGYTVTSEKEQRKRHNLIRGIQISIVIMTICIFAAGFFIGLTW